MPYENSLTSELRLNHKEYTIENLQRCQCRAREPHILCPGVNMASRLK